MRSTHISYILILISMMFLTHAENCIAQCQTPTLYGINRLSQGHVAIYSYKQTGTYYFEYGPVGFTPGTGATAGVGGNVQVINSTFGVSSISFPASGTYHCYVRLFCNNTTWTANSPVESYTITTT